jgi:hypothetical protein
MEVKVGKPYIVTFNWRSFFAKFLPLIVTRSYILLFVAWTPWPTNFLTLHLDLSNIVEIFMDFKWNQLPFLRSIPDFKYFKEAKRELTSVCVADLQYQGD